MNREQGRQPLAFNEERSFLDSGRFVPLSVSRYRVEGVGGWMPVLAAAARGRDIVVELVAFGAIAPENESLFSDVLAGLRIDQDG